MDEKAQLADIYRLIQQITEDDKLKKNAAEDGVYRDEPILRTAAQIPRPAQRSAVPERVSRMRDIAFADNMYWQPKERVFLAQAEFMEDYEDDLEYTGRFERYFPTYADMNIEQLRGYFTWRTAARRGEYRPAPVSFVSVLCYELINGIGAKSPEESIAKLAEIRGKCDIPASLKTEIDRWIKDLVIYHRLPAQLAQVSGSEMLPAVSALMNCGVGSDEELFDAVKLLSSCDIGKSPFYRAYPDDMRAVVCDVVRCLAGSPESAAELLGGRTRTYHQLFRTAVFVDKLRGRSFVYEFGDCERYECVNGIWYCEKLNVIPGGSRVLGGLLRSVDHFMRERYKFRFRLGGCAASPEEAELIAAAMDRLDEAKKREQTAKIEIDVTKLCGIRQSADIIRDRLIVEEEPEAPAAPELVPEPEQSVPEDSGLPLNGGELGYLRCLLYGGDANAAAKAAGSMPSLLADAINEKLFDLFGDTVIDLSGSEPGVIEDYTDELKGMITE